MTNPVITLPLPNQILDGQLADAVPVMGNFNYIANQVNAAIYPSLLTFSPTLLIAGSQTGIVYGAQLGNYFMIGGAAFVWGTIVLTSKGVTVGQVSFGGLPVAFSGSLVSNSLVGNVSIANGSAFTFSWANLFNTIGGFVSVAVSKPSTGTTKLQNTDITDTSIFTFSLIYPT